ncbi:unnamed protein product [Trifolium pratense]|uniref:Uncharacterized protein n=1 Tax=Trifolium pratense TaxID=57577 RepID=A0ACB0JYF0_TRIPR|nr:unnamed protein product [Trifolium pratense]
MRIFNSITEGNQFDEKLFISHPLADDLDRSLKSIRRVIHQRKKELQIEKTLLKEPNSVRLAKGMRSQETSS